MPNNLRNKLTTHRVKLRHFGIFNNLGGNRTQVIVDGTRTMESITDGTRDVVDASNMKAVEIQRGPASVLWGSDGLGGVIAFVTKDPEDYMKDGAKYGGAANISFSSLDDTFKESVAGAYQLSDTVSAMAVYTRRDSSEIELRNARIGADALQDCPVILWQHHVTNLTLWMSNPTIYSLN